MRVERFLAFAKIILPALLVAIGFGFALASGKILATDGAGYALNISDSRWFFLVGWHRHFAQYLTQFTPVFIGSLFKLSSDAVIVLYKANVYAVMVSSLVFSGVISRNRPDVFSVYAICLCIVVYQSDYVAMGEHQVFLFSSWPILLFVLFPTRHWPSRLIVLFFAVVAARSYEGGGLVCVMLALATAVRVFLTPHKNLSDRLYWSALLAVLICAVGVAVHGTLNPRDPTNMMGFATTILLPLGAPAVVAGGVFVVGYVLSAAMGKQVFPIVMMSGAILWLLLALYRGDFADSWQSFSARTLLVSVVPAMMLVTIVIALWLSHSKSCSFVLVVAFIFSLTTYSVASQQSWQDALSSLKQQLEQSDGLIQYEDVGAPSSQLFPYWTLPTLSILLQESCVKSIIEVPEGYPWQPFDPAEVRPLSEEKQFSRSLGGEGCSEH